MMNGTTAAAAAAAAALGCGSVAGVCSACQQFRITMFAFDHDRWTVYTPVSGCFVRLLDACTKGRLV